MKKNKIIKNFKESDDPSLEMAHRDKFSYYIIKPDDDTVYSSLLSELVKCSISHFTVDCNSGLSSVINYLDKQPQISKKVTLARKWDPISEAGKPDAGYDALYHMAGIFQDFENKADANEMDKKTSPDVTVEVQQDESAAAEEKVFKQIEAEAKKLMSDENWYPREKSLFIHYSVLPINSKFRLVSFNKNYSSYIDIGYNDTYSIIDLRIASNLLELQSTKTSRERKNILKKTLRDSIK